jgi:serine/threonine protein kinase
MDRYLVGERIARGGMGVLFRGRDERLHRAVCVKVFHGLDPDRPEYATVLDHFVQEAFTLSQLQHPNTVRIYDFGYLDEERRAAPYFVTEFADGGDLSTLIADNGPLSAADTFSILDPICGALSEAHEAGVVHRDLKPSNILFTRTGGGLIPKLADFSIAKALGDLPHRAAETSAGVPLYSLSWAAPEQLTAGRIDFTTDVFALGLMAAFMLSGQCVYPDADIMQIYTQRSRGSAHIEDVVAAMGLPSSLQQVLIAACAQDPHDRFPSVSAFLTAFEDALDVISAEPERHPVSVQPVVTAPPVQSAPPPVHNPARPHLVVESFHAGELVVGSRRVRLVDVQDGPISLPSIDPREPIRLRATPLDVGGFHVHVKGLNGFLQLPGGRPTGGVDITASVDLEISIPGRREINVVHVIIGTPTDDALLFALPDATLVVPFATASWVVLFVPAEGRDAILLHRPRTSSRARTQA